MNHMLQCPSCGSYALHQQCSCGHQRKSPKPPKYSPQDKYGEYRRKIKQHAVENQDH